jgi:predicted NBD/HSP70 family sugar kinase
MHPPIVVPRVLPPLDPDFLPAVLVNQKFRQDLKGSGSKAVIALERTAGETSRVELSLFPDEHPMADRNFSYVERIVKFLLWQRGGHTMYFSGSARVADYLATTYAADGARAFDYHFFGEKVYEQEFRLIHCAEENIPDARETGKKLGGNLNGYRIGFDLGASDRKVSAVVEGKPVFSEEVIWQPRQHSDPEYHYREILNGIKTAAAKLPRVDAIGGSSAGILIDNRLMVASLFRGIPEKSYAVVKDLFLRSQDEVGVPLEVINDGDVTALAGSMAIKENGILGIAMGSSQAAGYVNTDGHIMGWLNELAFASVDYNPNATIDEWSGDRGCGASYFSQQCVFRLAPAAGISIPGDLGDAEKLSFVQEKLESAHEGAVNIWKTMGVYLGYAIAHYADFYEINHVLILGRCTSGSGGQLLIEGANSVLAAEFPDLLQRIQLHLPDEKIRRVGQAVAAASLPYLPPAKEDR